MSVGLGFLYSLVSDQVPLSDLPGLGIDRSFFIGDELKVFEVIQDHFLHFSRLPSIRTIEAETSVEFPEFPEESIDYWADRIKRRRQSNLILRASRDAQNSIGDGQVDDAIQMMRDLALVLQESKKDEVYQFSELAQKVGEIHDRVRDLHGGISGVPFGIQYLDQISNGAQPGDTVAVVGRPGVGKSYMVLYMSLFAFDAGFRPLFLTMEMPPVQCARRLLALRTRISATRMRMGRVSQFGRDRMDSDVGSLTAMEEDGRKFIILAGTLNASVEDLALRCREIRPDVLYVDGAYLLRTKVRNLATWERVSETAAYLKALSIDMEIPIISTYQFNRKGPGNLGNIGLSDAIGQLASIVIGIEDENEDDGESFSAQQFKLLNLLKGREGEKGMIRMEYDINRMIISQESVLRGVRIEEDEND